MTGFVTTAETAAVVLASIRETFAAYGHPPFWSPGAYPIYSGPHAGRTFIPAGDDTATTPLRLNPLQRPCDFPEYDQFIATLGGLDARIDIDPADIKPPSDEL
jgi:hypothetical protein